MKKKKYILIIALTLLSIICPISADASEVMIITLKDGSQEEYILDERPEIKCSAENIFILTDEFETKACYSNDEVKSIHFSSKKMSGDDTPDVPSEIQEVVQNTKKTSFTFHDNIFTIEGADISSKDLRIVNLSGMSVKADVTQFGYGVRVSLQDVPAGVYIITVKKQSFKVLVR